MLSSFNSLCDMMSCTLFNHAYTEARSRRDMKKICKVARLLRGHSITLFDIDFSGPKSCAEWQMQVIQIAYLLCLKPVNTITMWKWRKCLEIACARGHDNCASLFLRRPGSTMHMLRALVYACEFGHERCIRALFEAGARVFSSDYLFIAIRNGRFSCIVSCIELLVKDVDDCVRTVWPPHVDMFMSG